MRLFALVLVALVACTSSKHAPPAPRDNIPDVSVDVEAPPRGEKIVIDGTHDVSRPPPKNTLEATLYAVAPNVTVATLVDTVLTLGQPEPMLLVRTPKGLGALPLPLPKAEAGSLDDEPRLVLAIAAGSQLFVGSRQVSLDALPGALRDSHRDKLFLTVDKSTSVADFAKVLALAHSAIPDIRFVLPPPEPIKAY